MNDDLLVQVADLRDYMSSIGLDADQEEAAEQVLLGVQRALERYCNRPLKRKERTERVFPDEYGRVWLQATPIWSISDPTGLEPARGHALIGSFAHLGYLGGGLTVTYVGGIDGDDEDDVKLGILRVAARELTVRHDDTLGVTDLSIRPAAPADPRIYGWTPEELKQFDRLRRRVVA